VYCDLLVTWAPISGLLLSALTLVTLAYCDLLVTQGLNVSVLLVASCGLLLSVTRDPIELWSVLPGLLVVFKRTPFQCYCGHSGPLL
jgi:hypothetical protein